MNHTPKFLLALVCLALSPQVFAQDASTDTVVINFNQVIIGLDPVKDALEELQDDEDFAALAERVAGGRGELIALRDELREGNLTLTDAQKIERQERILRKQQQLRLDLQQLNERQQQEVERAVRPYNAVIQQVAAEYFEAKGYKIVLNAESVVYAAPELSATVALTGLINERIADNGSE